jgi:hypothetical protein
MSTDSAVMLEQRDAIADEEFRPRYLPRVSALVPSSGFCLTPSSPITRRAAAATRKSIAEHLTKRNFGRLERRAFLLSQFIGRVAGQQVRECLSLHHVIIRRNEELGHCAVPVTRTFIVNPAAWLGHNIQLRIVQRVPANSRRARSIVSRRPYTPRRYQRRRLLQKRPVNIRCVRRLPLVRIALMTSVAESALQRRFPAWSTP